MTRRSGHSAHMRVSAASSPMVLDENMGQSKSFPRSEHQADTRSSSADQENMYFAGGNAGSSQISAQDADNEDDAMEDDDDEDDDEPGDGHAPSDDTTMSQDHQPGLIDVSDDAKSIGIIQGIRKRDAVMPQENQHNQIVSSPQDHDKFQYKLFEIDNLNELLEPDDLAYNEVDNISDSDNGFQDDFDSSHELATPYSPYEEQLPLEPLFNPLEVLSREMKLFRANNRLDDWGFTPQAQNPVPTPRRVHFNVPPMPLSDSSDNESDDEDIARSYSDRNKKPEKVKSVKFDRLVAGESDISGYETDYGDTTEEEKNPPSATCQPKSILRRPSQSSVVPCPPRPENPFKFPSGPNVKPPQAGFFKRDLTKGAMWLDASGDNFMMINPEGPNVPEGGAFGRLPSTGTSTAVASPRSPRHTNGTLPNHVATLLDDSSHLPANLICAPVPKSIVNDPPLANSGLGGHHQGDDSVFVSQHDYSALNTAYAVDDQADDGPADDSGDVGSSDGDPFEGLINWTNSSDEDKALNGPLPTPSSTSPTGMSAGAPMTTSPGSPATNNLMADFDRSLIGSFRQGQGLHNQQQKTYGDSAFKAGRMPFEGSSPNSPRKRKSSGSLANTRLHGLGSPTKKMRLHN